MDLLFIYLLLINALGFVLMLWDKHRARKKQWRISEATLLTTALLGGSAGCLLGMYTARHKIRKARFAIGIPLILFLQTVVGLWLGNL